MIGKLIDAGMDVARLNFSHGDTDSHLATLRMVRSEAQKRGRAIAILQDLQGPKIRVGKFAHGFVELPEGSEFTITTRDVVGDEHIVSTSYKHLPGDVRPGDLILLDDGYLSMEVVRVDGEDVKTRVVQGGTLKDKKGINLPGVKISAPALTEKDRADLAFGLRAGVDFIALSFVRAPSDVSEARRLATTDEHRIPIIAKLEKPEAVERLEEIIEVADGVMVARGDLGVEVPIETIAITQKSLIARANLAGKPVITTSIASNREVTDNGAFAYLVPAKDVDGLAAAMIELAGDSRRRIELGERGRERQREQYSMTQMLAAHDELYRELAARHATTIIGTYEH